MLNKATFSERPPHDFAEPIQPNPPPHEMLPPDAIQLSYELKRSLQRFSEDPSLLPAEAIGIAEYYVSTGEIKSKENY